MLRKAFQQQYTPMAILVALGLLTRLAFISYPNEVVFDEVHFGKFISAYYTHEYYFDIHPPLGKLLIAGWGKLFGFRAGFDFANIGQPYGHAPYMTLRFLPILIGGLIPAAEYGFLLALGISVPAAFLAASFVVFDNAFLVQSRFILIDSFYLFFGFSGLWLFFSARRQGYRLTKLMLASSLLALSVSVKWVGLSFLGLAVIVMAVDQIRSLKNGRRIAVALAMPVAIYLLVFWIHFSLLTKSGPGDPFMSGRFLKDIQGSTYATNLEVKPLNLLAKTLELNQVMLSANASLQSSHPYASNFYTWPLMERPISYWIKDCGNGRIGYVYFLGNPIVWWLSTLGVIGALFGHLKRWMSFQKPSSANCWLYIGYALNFLPFASVSRVLFLYHYLAALGFAAAIVSAALFDSWEWSNSRQRILWVLLLAIVAAAFVFFAPLSYGWPLDGQGHRNRMWLSTWI